MGKTEREVENLTHAAARLELKSASASASSAARLAMGALQVQPLHAPTHSSHIPGSGSSRTVRKGSVDAASSNAPRPAPSAAAAGSGAGGAVDTARSRVVVDIGKYDGSMERDERRGRRTGDFSAAQLEAMALDSANTTAHSVTRKWNVNSFETGRAMGKGRFGRVYIARTKPDENGQHGDFIVALKLMYKREVAQGGLERQIRREVEIQQTLRHPHVLRLYGYFHDEGRIFLMLEFAARGEMYKIMSKLPHNHWTEKQAARYTGQMADGLAYLHSKHIIHRDIKPENLLVGLNDDLKIADFGWSVHAQGDRRRTSCGTLDYMPPEMTRGESHGHQVDLWAFGVLIYEFIVGFPPFDSLNPENEQRDAAERVPGQTNPYTHRRIQKQDYVFPADFPRDCADLVWRLLRNDASKRLPLDMLLQHPWLTKFESQVYARAKKAGYLKDTPAHKRPPSPSTPILFERR